MSTYVFVEQPRWQGVCSCGWQSRSRRVRAELNQEVGGHDDAPESNHVVQIRQYVEAPK